MLFEIKNQRSHVNRTLKSVRKIKFRLFQLFMSGMAKETASAGIKRDAIMYMIGEDNPRSIFITIRPRIQSRQSPAKCICLAGAPPVQLATAVSKNPATIAIV
tara:strand:+ start:33793 stop:34101 length:309 start_codon:yes stop_codon:yes gene_type:complete